MATFYAGQVRRGKITIDDVPYKWRAETEKLLGY